MCKVMSIDILCETLSFTTNEMMKHPLRPSTTPSPARESAATSRQVTVTDDCVSAERLLGADGRLFIVLDGRHYQLTRTRNNKLILTL